MSRVIVRLLVLVAVIALVPWLAGAQADAPLESGLIVGPSSTLAAAPPWGDDRVVVLFDGTSWADGWRQRDGAPSAWVVQDDGSAEVTGGDAISVAEFGDFQLHLEFMCPEMPGKEGQARANSGVYLHGRYEVQVLDTFGQEPFAGACGALYGVAPPQVNASRPPGLFQTYDVTFRAPRFDENGIVAELPRVTVMHNGIIIHNNVEIPKATPGGIDDAMTATGPLLLQDHGDPVRYRNVWMRRLD